ncbi:hypothetical protein SKTS_13540 [Sulfurimicrobium lacus]|uniref:Mu-like prophage FluMu I protein n=1 Tax=Sulfurimicrobium lacus TaxID=2715678 RepID=A0A6F8V9T5_9PROT|nr:phage protease [Sulfurimicrobium lacus]BCB26468.1 hypothetical protein SKTS_13540 [Sulfurimicrobium lacus]
MTTRLASLVAQLTPGEKTFRLIPAGAFRSSDGSGRPKDVPAWYIDADDAVQVIARNAARKSSVVIDYEHQTLLSAQNGQPAPASGWVASMEWRDDGLYATADWTERAGAMIDKNEYRYISPVFSYDKTGRVLDVKLVGLTNNPGLDGLTDLAALSAHFSTQEESPMNELMERLRYLLNLPLTTTPEEMAGELDKIKVMITGAGAASLTAYLDTQTTQIAALKAASPDPAQFVPVGTMRDLQERVAALSAQINAGEVDTLVDAALTANRLFPAQEEWARNLGKTNIAALRGYLETAPEIAALTATQTGGKNLDGKSTNQSDVQLAVCKALGLSTEQFAAGKVE